MSTFIKNAVAFAFVYFFGFLRYSTGTKIYSNKISRARLLHHFIAIVVVFILFFHVIGRSIHER